MPSKITVFCSLLLVSFVFCDTNIGTNDDDYIKKLFNIDELKTKIRSSLGNISDADLATVESKFYCNCGLYPDQL